MFFQIVIALVVLSFTSASGAHASSGSEWSYEGTTGPNHWGELGNPRCATGQRQSPIDVTETTQPMLPPIRPITLTGAWGLDRPLTITNNGHTVQANLNGAYASTGGPLNTTVYLAEQFHFHWGSTDDVGSEHTVEGQAYPAEMHIVHYDSTRFNSVSHAMAVEEGLAVFGFFISIGQEDNPAIQPIVDAISGLATDQTRHLAAPFNLRKLLPVIDSYWSYPGSLTTPPCYESVIWTVFQTPISISQTQMEAFRQLGNAALLHPINDNYRPTWSVGKHRYVTYKAPPAI